MINKRVMKIVEVLLNQETYNHIDRISEQLSVSNKTIRNDLQLVDEWLKGNQLQLSRRPASAYGSTVLTARSCASWKMYANETNPLSSTHRQPARPSSACSLGRL